MKRLTHEERRRTFLARQEAGRQMLAETFQPISVMESSAPRSWLSQVLGMGMIVALLGGGWIAWQSRVLRAELGCRGVAAAALAGRDAYRVRRRLTPVRSAGSGRYGAMRLAGRRRDQPTLGARTTLRSFGAQ